MIAEAFVDTNVLVYAAIGRGSEENKRTLAVDLLAREEFGLSAQVLQEFYVTVTRKAEVPLAPAVAVEWIEQLEVFPVIAVDAGLVKTGAEISERFQISYWDGAIVAAAHALGAVTLFSEDLNDGQQYGKVRVINPFR